jgi:hypothetical protein
VLVDYAAYDLEGLGGISDWSEKTTDETSA